MLRFPSLWSLATITTYRNHGQNFSRATFEPHKATASLAECFYLVWFDLGLFLNCRLQCPGFKDELWPWVAHWFNKACEYCQVRAGAILRLGVPGMEKNTAQLQSSRKTENMVVPPESISPLPQDPRTCPKAHLTPFPLLSLKIKYPFSSIFCISPQAKEIKATMNKWD